MYRIRVPLLRAAVLYARLGLPAPKTEKQRSLQDLNRTERPVIQLDKSVVE